MFEQEIAAVSTVLELLDEQILRIGASVGHSPGDVLVVREVHHARHARHGVADDLKIRR